MFTSKIRTAIALLAFVATALFAGPLLAEEGGIPETVAEHEARAHAYKTQAAQHRAAAEEHRQMAKAYAKRHPDPKGGGKNPWNAKMQKHCMTLAKDFEKLATNAEKAADYHTMRAKEMQGE
jgi:hypothetical protein